MADLVPVNSSVNGVAMSLVAATAGGDLCPQAKRILLMIVNGGASPCNATVHGQNAACGDPSAHDEVTTVPAGATKIIGPFNRAMYNDSADKLEIKYDQVSSVTIGAIEVAD